jgi:hypothetical protein
MSTTDKKEKRKYKNMNKWIIEGQLNETPEINFKKGRSHATIRVGVETGEIVIFAHDESIVRDVRKLNSGDKVRLIGAIETRDPKLRLNSPYFLNPDFLEKLD